MNATKRSFRASRQLKLHQRAVDVLDMIVTCDMKYGDAVDYLAKYDAEKNWMKPIRFMNDRSFLVSICEKYAAIKQRLTKWYIDIMRRIEDIAILHAENVNQNENY